MEYKLNNAEFVLLLLIAERPGINGYQLRQTVVERGMDAWAGVSNSSIYVVLKKLAARNLITSKPDTEKRTKGAQGQVYTLEKAGKVHLMEALDDALSRCREHDQRFNIGLSGSEFLAPDHVMQCLKKRQLFLRSELERLTEAERAQDGLPVSAVLLFDRIRNSITSEITWVERAMARLAKEDI